jgi:hypothetical protein
MRLLMICSVILALTACGSGGHDGDGDGGSPETVNTPPTSNAGPDQIVNEGAAVTLVGSGTDAQSPVAYSWTQLAGPAITLNDTKIATPAFTAPAITVASIEVQLQLTVTDSAGANAQDIVVITVNDFAAATGAWGEAQLIEEDENAEGRDPRVATNANGQVVAVWCQGSDVWANRYVEGNGWQTAAPIKAMTGRCEISQVAVDANGNAIAVWDHEQDSIHSIWASVYIADTGWNTPVLLENSDDTAGRPQVAFDASGTAHVIWQGDHPAFHSNVWTRRYTVASGWTEAQLLEDDDVERAYSPQLAANENGDVMAVWRHGDNGQGIMVAGYTSATGWGSASSLVTEGLATTGNTLAIALDNAGNAIVAWEASVGSNIDIHANRYVPGSGWQGEIVLDTLPGVAYAPQVSFDGAGNAIAVWYQLSGSKYHVFANRFVVADTNWEGASPIENIENNYSGYRPQLGVDHSGNALVITASHIDHDQSIWASRYVVDQGWSAPELIEVQLGRVHQPHLVVDPTGRAMAVWPQFNRETFEISIWANRFQ